MAAKHAIDGWDTNRGYLIIACRCGWTHTEQSWRHDARQRCQAAMRAHKREN